MPNQGHEFLPRCVAARTAGRKRTLHASKSVGAVTGEADLDRPIRGLVEGQSQLAEQLAAAAGLPSAAEEMAHPAGSGQGGQDQPDASKPIGVSLVLVLLEVSILLCVQLPSWQNQHSMMHMHLAGLALCMIQMHHSDGKGWMSDDVSFVAVISKRLLASWPACGVSLLSVHAALPCRESSALQVLQAVCA
jgi:hypothetical protein